MRVRGCSSIGPAQVIAEHEVFAGTGMTRFNKIASITIPDDDLADTVAELLLRCYQQSLWSDSLKAVVKAASDGN